MHVSTRRQEKWRNGKSSQNKDANEKNARENIVRRLEMKRVEELTQSHDIESLSK
jgi:hypothetical protein